MGSPTTLARGGDASQNTSHDICRGSFSPSPLIPSHKPPLSQCHDCKQPPIDNVRPTIEEYHSSIDDDPAQKYRVLPIEDTYRPTPSCQPRQDEPDAGIWSDESMRGKPPGPPHRWLGTPTVTTYISVSNLSLHIHHALGFTHSQRSDSGAENVPKFMWQVESQVILISSEYTGFWNSIFS